MASAINSAIVQAASAIIIGPIPIDNVGDRKERPKERAHKQKTKIRIMIFAWCHRWLKGTRRAAAISFGDS